MTLNPNIHRKNMVRVLKKIYSDDFLRPILGFKGGTAAYLFYGLDRFSVDLDFDLLEEGKKEQVLKKLEKIVEKDWKVKDAEEKRYTLFFLLSYAKDERNIKIEINKRGSDSKFKIEKYLGVPMLIMEKEDMAANKLVAMTERKRIANRDIYDVYFFLDRDWPINKELVEKKIGIDFSKYLEKCIEFLKNIDNSTILSGMGELIGNKRKHWVKNNLKKEAIFQMKLLRDSLEK